MYKYLLTLLTIGLIFFYIVEKNQFESENTLVCTDSVKILDIVSAQHRSVKVKLSNGEIIEINQPTKEIKDGDDYCFKSAWKENK